ncbi:NUDIX hydrolase [Falsiroseomonas oryziterrae]|uniref:NUDIX hydrolase n=1 Tax=Falsiroseomonas oryziterrae TaxID=2911368 RepID=UPI001F316F35|nr:NUDIX hydrolase [Roseomonas sp. NPKOSM-4]
MPDTPPWTTLQTRQIVEDRWINLRAETVRTDRGAVLSPWYVLSYPDWTAVVPLTDDDRLVLVRQWRHAAGAWCLELPGGVIDPGEADPVAAGCRELLEETGHAPRDARLLYSAFPNPATQANRMHVVLATGCVPSAPVAHEAGESMRVECVPVAEVLAGIGSGLLAHGLHVGAALAGLAAVGRIRL